ncbi:MAG: sigma-54-dependent Fis family transcriptional regulator [Gemmatimonadetes bacterium]|nr:MAG: sigma-54-dependent Fis family transcriptional regulator [Gemmatimonadota bacterium]
MNRILIVEDKEGMRHMLEHVLKDEGFSVISATNGEEGIARVENEKFDLVLTDLKMPRKSGLDVLRAVKETDSRTPVILMTAFGTVEDAVEAMKDGAFDFITKPFDPDHLVLLIRRALEKIHLATENLLLKEAAEYRHGLPTIIGKSTAMEHVSQMIQQVAPSDTTILIMGESGTGKELFARAIHSLSPRHDNPFVAINCAAIPRELLESELFGHEKGAFTSAIGQKIGKFELAGNGTIFLDEIGDMDLALQAKLLRVLQEREFERVGSSKLIPMRARIIAATNQNLQAKMEEKHFREDLYYRIHVFPITIPPLRDRLEDVPLLAQYFVDKYRQEMKKPIEGLSKGALQKLQQYHYPGNVRELQNTIERAVILCNSSQIESQHILIQASQRSTPPLAGFKATKGESLKAFSTKAMQQVEANYIREVLAQTGGNKTQAAKVLQVSYKTLLTKIKDYGLE